MIESGDRSDRRSLVKQINRTNRTPAFDPVVFLSTIGKGREMLSFQKKGTIFTQGDSTDGLFFIQNGKVRLRVVSESGKEATLAILGEKTSLEKAALPGSSYACHPQLQSQTACFYMLRRRR
jgi:CRP-like cAMP-binding protein